MTWTRKLALLVPLLLVNSMAVWGQAGWAYDHLVRHLAVAVLFAAAVESIGVYLAWEAHAALMADQAAGLLRAGSYGVGVLVGVLNYAHFAGDGYGPTAQAVTFGLLSAISPWLWAIRSRSLNRDRLRELGMVDERGLKLSTNRKLWHPIKSLRVIRWAAWSGVTKPAEAVSGWEASRRGDVFDVGPLELARAANAALSAALDSDELSNSGRSDDGQDDVIEAVTVPVTVALEAAPEPAPADGHTDVQGDSLSDAEMTATEPVNVAPESPSNDGPDDGHTPVTRPAKRAPRRTPTGTPKAATRVHRAAAKMPGAPAAQIAKKAGVSESTARRHLAALNGHNTTSKED